MPTHGSALNNLKQSAVVYWIEERVLGSAVLRVLICLPVQPVAKIDGEHLVLVAPDDQSFLWSGS